jgi:tetratricopeptide (TPR) repeat protein
MGLPLDSLRWLADATMARFVAPEGRLRIVNSTRNAAAHAVLANALITYDRDLAGTERELNRAFALSKSPGAGFVAVGVYFIATGRADSAITLLRSIEALDPLNPILKGWNAWMLSTVDRNDEGIDEAHRALELDPSNPYAYFPVGDALRAKGQMQAAIDAYQHALGLGNRARAALAGIYAAVRRRAEALALLDSLRAVAKQRYVGADVIGTVYAALGQRDEAFRCLDKALVDRCGQLIFAGFDHRWDPLRGDPRFARLMQKLGMRVLRHAIA